MNAITNVVLRHKLATILVWLALAVVGFATMGATTHRLKAQYALPGQPGYVADQKIQTLFHNGGNDLPSVVTATAPSGTRIDPAQAHAMFAAAAAAIPGSRLADESTTNDPKFVTTDGSATFALVFTPQQNEFSNGAVTPKLNAALAAVQPPGWQHGVTGYNQLAVGNANTKGTSTTTEVIIGGVGSLAVLAFVFGSLLALLPLLMAAFAIPTTFLLVGGVTYLTDVSMLVDFVVALIGLGVAIDYSLLVVTRWREERDCGHDNEQAVRNAMDRAGHAVVFSGLTVGISLVAVLVVPVPFLRSLAVAGFFIPLVSIAVALTALPALLASIGPRIDRPRLRHEAHASRPWSAWARFVLKHRVSAAVVGGAALIALLVPLTGIRLGDPTSDTLAQNGPAHTALTQLTAGGVPSGTISPMEVLTTADSAPAVAARLGQVPGVYTAIAPATGGYRAGGDAIVDVLPVAESSTPDGKAAISAVQSAAHGTPGVLGVGGAGPTQNDFIHAVYGHFPLMLTVISLLTLILLARAFRSLVLAAKAVVFNLLSVGAAYGVMVLVWQHGLGNKALWGVPATGTISTWIPLMVFAFLFGLSMDYEVFILTRMREEFDATGSTDQAVVTGISRTGRLVTSAALILFLSFLSMSTNPEVEVKVMATGLGAGILLDALIVRSLLVPALVGVFGRWNWWLPAWAATVLRVEPSPLPAADARIEPTGAGAGVVGAAAGSRDRDE